MTTAAADPAVDDRKGYLGGSDAAAICGASKWKDRATVYAETLGLPCKPKEESVLMEMGNLHEETVARIYARETGRRVFRSKSTRHPDYSFLLAHTDRRVKNDPDGTRRGLEIKTAYPRTAEQWQGWGESGTDLIPLDAMFQVSHYLGVTGFDVFDVAVLLNGHDFRIFHIKRDEGLIATVLAKEVEFWDKHIVPQNPPEIENADTAVLLYPKANGVYIDIPKKMLPLLVEFDALCDKRKRDKDRHDWLRARILGVLKDREGFKGPNGKPVLHARAQSRTSYPAKHLRERFPEIAEQIVTHTKSRVISRTDALSFLQVEDETEE